MEQYTFLPGVPPQPYSQTSDFIDCGIKTLPVPSPRLPPLVLALETVADRLYRPVAVECVGVDPTLQLGTRLSLDHVGRVDSNVEAHNQRHTDLCQHQEKQILVNISSN